MKTHFNRIFLAAKRVLLFSILLSVLVGCGGGGAGDAGGGNNISPLTGRISGIAVSNLEYETDTQSGMTNAAGEFQYLSGETVRFYIGDIFLGEVDGASDVTLFDFAGITAPVTSLEIRKAVNEMERGYQPLLGSAVDNEVSRKGRNNLSTPLEQVINLAVFLQTLDEDGFAADGIHIPDQVHKQAIRMNLNFKQEWESFRQDYTLRKLIADVRNAGVWGGVRVIRNSAYALDAVYDSLGLTPVIFALSGIDNDNNADDVIDKRVLKTYDANGHVATESQDTNADGVLDRHNRYSYDSNGNRVLNESDDDRDGVAEQFQRYIFDSNGYQSRYENDSSADGSIDQLYTFTYDSNGYGNLQRYEQQGTGVTTYREQYFYDATSGHQVLYEKDNGADGAINARETYQYDNAGNLVVYERDSNSNTIDGVIDERDSFSYDSFGNLIQFDDDTNAVGPVNRRIFYTFDYRHRLELVEYDANVDGTVDSSGSLIYDNNANLISSGIETYFYDAVNNLTLREIDFNSDGVNINRRRYIFDSNGYLVTFERDNNGDDIVETRRTYQYVPVNRWSVFIN